MRFWGMLRFTIGETIRRGTLIFYFCVATCIIVFFALGVSHSPDNHGTISIFGSQLPDQSQTGLNAAELILLQLHSSSVFWIILFGIFGVAGLIPGMLEKGTIDLFLSKPLTRAELLMARALGAAAGIAVNLIYFYVGIWLVFGLKAGVWHWGFLSSVIYVIYAFTCLFSIVAIAGLITRSAGFSILITFSFALISSVLETREKFLYLLWDNNIYHRILDVFYYLTPQLNAMLENSSRVISNNLLIFNPVEFTFMPFLYSLLSASLLYGLSIWYFSRRDF
jgi:ABC-type transport system involved in multi-copper enzyme maturation permease subunit